LTQKQPEAMHRQPGVVQSLRRASMGDADAPEADAEPREADVGPNRLTPG